MALSPAFQRLASVVNIAIRRKNAMAYNFDLPGFKYDDLDRTGSPSLRVIARVFDSAWFTAAMQLPFDNFDSFVLGYNLEITRELYQRSAMIFPMTAERSIKHAGRTSCLYADKLVDSSLDTVLIDRVLTSVCVDMSSRKPQPLPEYFLDSVHRTIPEMKSEMLPRMIKPFTSVPPLSFTYVTAVRYDDIDHYRHVTHASYSLFATECSASAVRALFYSKVHELSLVHRLRIIFVSECTAGDQLTVTTWEDDVNPLLVRFLIKRERDGRDLCFAEMEYYPDDFTERSTTERKNSVLLKANMSLIYDRYSRAINIPKEPDKNGYKFKFPGFKYDDFDRNGQLSLRRLVKFMDIARCSEVLGTTEFNIFVLGFNMEIKPELYERAAVESPITLERQLIGVGKTSLSFTEELIHSASGSLLASRELKGVWISLVDRRPTPVSDEYMKQFKKYPAAETTLPFRLIEPMTDIPDRSFSCSLTVRADDTEPAGHSSHPSYVLYATECSAAAARAEFYREVREDSLSHKLRVLYVGEAAVGERLTVTTWDDDTDTLLVKFVVKMERDGRDICYVEIEYFPEEFRAKL